MSVSANDRFRHDARTHDFVPLARRLLSDTLTPVSAFRRLDHGGPACLFESVIGGEKVGRYSFLATDPIVTHTARGNQWKTATPATETSATGMPVAETRATENIVTETVDRPLDRFRRHLRYTVAKRDELPPFVGGAIGYAAYDVVRYVENLPDAPPDDRQLPDLDFSFYHEVCVFDHVSKTIWLITLADCRGLSQASSDSEIDAVQRSAEERLQSMFVKLTAAGDSPSSASAETARLKTAMPEASLEIATTEQELPELDVESNFTRESFHQAVDQCVEYIRAGDIFQVVPSQRLSVQSDVPPLEVYRSLRVVNPSPFMFFLRASNCTLIGCSPEIMCRVHEGEVTVRPLAGTRPRGKDDDHDKELEKELLADPKERAEHVMLVDLGRNDVGRVAQFGTVSLPEVMVVERYSHVMHISSEVRGRLREGLDAFDALGSALPAGTVSGAPKVRAMQVIDSLEPHRRGPYGGAVGYIDYRGNMDTCIALRTMVYTNGRYDVQAGCGVVADSQPEAEYQETLNKAQAMIAAIRAAAARTRS